MKLRESESDYDVDQEVLDVLEDLMNEVDLPMHFTQRIGRLIATLLEVKHNATP